MDFYDKDVWWKGAIVYVAPAGVQVTFPALNHNTQFCKSLARLRPGYECDIGAQQWVRRQLDEAAWKKLALPDDPVSA